MRRCRFCKKDIKDASRTCEHCGADLVQGRQASSASVTSEQVKKCPFCKETVLADAIKCKHCSSMLDGSGAQKVMVSGVDPFALYHSEIQGKKTGKITVVGYMGVGLGILFVLGGFAMMGSSRDGGEGGVMFALMGVGASVGSYLWARR